MAWLLDNTDKGEDGLEDMATQWGLCTVYLTDEEGKVDKAFGGSAKTLDDAGLSRLVAYAHGEDDHAYYTVDDVCYYLSKRDDGSYVVGGVESSEMIAKQDERFTAAYSLNNMKIGTGGYIIAVNKDDNTIAYTRDESLIGSDASALGIDDALVSGQSGWVTMDGEKWFFSNKDYSDADGSNYLLIALVSKNEITSSSRVVVWCVMIVSILALLAMIIYTIFLDMDEAGGYVKGSVRFRRITKTWIVNKTRGKKLMTVVSIAFIALIVGTAYIHSLSSVSRQRLIFDNKLSDIDTILDNNDARTEELTETYNQEYSRRAQNIAWTLGYAPELATTESLAALCETAQIKSIEIFDGKGSIELADRPNMVFKLSSDESSDSYVFWQIVNGFTDLVIGESAESESTGEVTQFIGVSRCDGEAGMVEIAVRPSRLENRLATTELNHVLNNIAIENGGFLFAVDAETKEFVSYPEEKYLGRLASDYGMTDASFKDDYVGWQRIDGEKCFVMSREHEGVYIYTAVASSLSVNNLITVTAASGIAGLIMLLIMLLVSMTCRPSALKARVEDKSILENRSFEVQLSDGTVSRTTAATSRWDGSGLKFSDLDASGKMNRLIKGALFATAIIALLAIALGITEKSSLMTFILSRRWEQVFNLFSVTYVIYASVVILAVTEIIRWAISLVFGMGSTRMITFGRLLSSFVRYASVIGVVFYGLSFFGFDSQTLLTGAGILTLIVGLGAQQLVSDILAGLFIVFEGEFRVGDIVTIDGWRGTVEEIGIRTTKVLSPDKDVKIFRNSSISGVINLTRQYSVAYADLSIQSSESLEEVEKMFRRELPRIKKRLPSIIEGPHYDGVLEIGAENVSIRVSAICQEKDRGKLQMDLNRELKLILDSQDKYKFVSSKRLS